MSDEAETGDDEAAIDSGEEAATDGGEEVLRASDLGGEGPPVEEKPYKIVFEANKCFGAGKCAEVADNWVMDVVSGMAKPETYYIGEEDLAENVRAAEACPAKKEAGVIHVVDRRTDEEIAPDPHGDGTLSVDW